jgi:NAD(P)-dependent dehydrogenase (short-subunit alcohol dehydrogenase family)
MRDKPVRVVLVTGANRGIGFEVCRQLATRSFVVVLTARDATKARAAADMLSSVGHVEPLVLDVADANSIAKARAEVASRYRCLDVLINNAGIHYDTWERVENATIDGTVMEAIAPKTTQRLRKEIFVERADMHKPRVILSDFRCIVVFRRHLVPTAKARWFNKTDRLLRPQGLGTR